jgi:signal transduction histidine kinase
MFLKSLNLRLAALFSALFLVCAIVLFSGTYFLLYSSLRREEYYRIQSRLLEFWALYQSGGIDALKTEIIVEKSLEYRRPFLLRVANDANATLFLYLPSQWRNLRFRNLEYVQMPQAQHFLLLPLADGHGALELAGVHLSDGNSLELAFHSSDWQDLLTRFRKVFTLIAAPLLVLSFLAGLVAASRALQPVKHLTSAFQTLIRTGKFDARVPESGSGDELDALASLYNGMLAKIETLVTGMRGALDNVAHDLRTPLARLKATAESALQGPPATRGRALESCLEETERIQTMLNTLMDISEAETGVMRLERRRVQLAGLIDDLRDLYGYVAAERGISLEASSPPELEVDADVNRLRQVIANLLDNAMKYTKPGGRVTIEASRDGTRALIRVRDSGVGIPASELPHIWERLYRGDRSRSTPGLGLGLSLVRAIVQAHGGEVSVRSRPEEGSEFQVSLPLSA